MLTLTISHLIYLEATSIITSGAACCIAATAFSLAFVGCETPLNTPNMRIDEFSLLKRENAALKQDNEKLVQQHEKESSQLKKENIQLKKELGKYKKKDETQSSEIHFRILDEDEIGSLEKIEEIGSGGGGRVFKVAMKEFYALKVMNISKSSIANICMGTGFSSVIYLFIHILY